MDIRIGKVKHFYSRLGVAVIDVEGELELGQVISIQGHTTDLVQRAFSMEIDHQKIFKAGPGMEIALKVNDPVRKGDQLYKVAESEELAERI